MFLILKQSQLEFLKEKVFQQEPLEACALIFGKLSTQNYFLEKLVFVSNVRKSKVEFEIDPQILLEEIIKAKNQELDLLGFFHSHPAAPYPSEIDLRNMSLWMDYIWLIFSLTEKKIAAYLLKNNKLEKVQLKIKV